MTEKQTQATPLEIIMTDYVQPEVDKHNLEATPSQVSLTVGRQCEEINGQKEEVLNTEKRNSSMCTCEACGKECKENVIQCSKCSEWVHFECSMLPAYQLLIFIHMKKTKYFCAKCAVSKVTEGERYLRDIEEILQKEDEHESRDNSTEIYDLKEMIKNREKEIYSLIDEEEMHKEK